MSAYFLLSVLEKLRYQSITSMRGFELSPVKVNALIEHTIVLGTGDPEYCPVCSP